MAEAAPAKKKGGLKIFQCPWCGGETCEGEAFVHLTASPGRVPSVFGMMGVPRFGVMSGETASEQKMQWREKARSRTAWLTRSNGEKTMRIFGRRCTVCGHIEFYARDST